MLLEDFLQAGLGHAPCAFIAAISHAQWLVSQNAEIEYQLKHRAYALPEI